MSDDLNIAGITVDLKANTTQYTKSLDDAATKAQSTTSSISTSLRKLGDASRPLKDTSDSVAALGKQSQTTGEQLLTLGGAASKTGNLLTTNFKSIYKEATTATTGVMGFVNALRSMQEAYRAGGQLNIQATIAGLNNKQPISASQVTALAAAGGTQNLSGYLDLFNASGGKNLRDIAAQLEAIKDPTAKAQKAVELFGDNAGKALELLNQRFIDNSDRVQDWGLTLTGKAKDNVLEFRNDVDSLGGVFDRVGDMISAREQKMEQDTISHFAAMYVAAKNFVGQMTALAEKNSAVQALHGAFDVLGAASNPKAPGYGWDPRKYIQAADYTYGIEAQRNLQAPTTALASSAGKQYSEDAIASSLTDLSRLNATPTSLDGLREKLERLKSERSKIFGTYFQIGAGGKIEFKDDLSGADKANATSYLGTADSDISAIQKQVDAAEQAKKDADEAARKQKEAAQERAARFSEIQAAVQGSQAKLNVAGENDLSPYAKAAAETATKVAELNAELAKQGSQLTLAQKAWIRAAENTIALNDAETKWKDKLAAGSVEIQARIAAQNRLTAAVGDYAQTQAALVENQLQQEFGAEYDNPKRSSDVNARRTELAGEQASKQATASAESIEQLQRETAATIAMTAAERLGGAAARQKAIDLQVEEMQRRKATQAEIDAYKASAQAKQNEDYGKQQTDLNQQIKDTIRLNNARLQGARAYLAVQIAIEQEAAKREGRPDRSGEIAAQHQGQIDAQVASRVTGKSDQIDDLKEQLEVLQRMQQTDANRLQIQEAIRDVNKEINKVLAEQELQSDKALDGLKAYFHELVAETKTAADQIASIMKQATDDINSNLAKMVTGQKASWGSLFTNLSQTLIKNSLQTAEGRLAKLATPGATPGTFPGSDGGGTDGGAGLGGNSSGGGSGILGKALRGLGIGGAAAKRDGNLPTTALYVTLVNASGSPVGSVTNSGAGANAGGNGSGGFNLGNLANGGGGGIDDGFGDDDGSDSGSVSGGASGGGGFWSTLLQAVFGGGKASGGPVDYGTAYLVGEQGPELWTPPSAGGKIIPNNKLGGGSTHYYSIDARGTDPVLTEQRTRAAIIAAHNSAVVNSVKVNNEQLKRMPRR